MDSPFGPKRSSTELTQFRILCPSARTGAVIGKGGSTVRQIQSLTGAKVRLLDDPHPCDERVIVISHVNPYRGPKADDGGGHSNTDNNIKSQQRQQEDDVVTGKNTNVSRSNEGETGGEDGWSPVQRALVRVFEKIVKGDSEEELGEGVFVVCRVLVGSNQAGSVLGRGGKVVEKIRLESGAQVRVVPWDQIPACAIPGDELIQITGNFLSVKKALLSLSSCLHENPRVEAVNSAVTRSSGSGIQGNAMPAQMELPQRGYPPGPHAVDYSLKGYSPNMGPENTRFHNRIVGEEEVVFKLLCQPDKVGSLIGKGGSIIRALQNETGASIKIADAVSDSDERMVVISARENSEQRHSPAQDAVIHVHSRITEIGFERGNAVVARLLVHSQQVGCLLGKGGQIITEMRQVTGASICIFPREQASNHSSRNDEVVQVIGTLQSVQDALFHITSRLREIIFPIKTPWSSTAAPPYPRPFQEMHSPRFRPRFNPASPGPYPSQAGHFHGIDHSGVPSHPHDYQPPFPYGVDHTGPPNMDRGPHPHGVDRPGHGFPFESSPRSWTQPYGDKNSMGGSDVCSGLAARNGTLESGSHASNLTSTSVEVVVPQKLLCHVYGENNSNLSHIRQISAASVVVHEQKPGATEGVIVLSGTPDQVRAAQSLIHAFILCGLTTP